MQVPKVACKTPFSFRLCTLFKLIPALNLYPAISIMIYKLPLQCDDKVPIINYKLPFRLSLCTETSREPVESGYIDDVINIL